MRLVRSDGARWTPAVARRGRVEAPVAPVAAVPTAPAPSTALKVKPSDTQKVMEALAKANAEPTLAFLAVDLNTMKQGERLVYVTPDGEPHLKVEDVRAMHLETPGLGASVRQVDGVAWVPLSALQPGLESAVSLDELTLTLTADPARLAAITLAAREKARRLNTQAAPGSAFLNYAVSSQCGADWSCGTLARTEVGAHALGMLFFTDAVFSDADSQLMRGVSRVTKDFPEQRARLQVGDVSTRTGAFGSGAMVGGVGFFTEYTVDPTFVRYGLPSIEGLAARPSHVDVFVNGNRIAQHEVPAGPFTITDIPSTMGAGEAQVRVRDAFGREQLIERPFYQASSLLAPGLQEYGAWVGALREDFGAESWSYGSPAAFGTYRRGLTHAWTAGAHAEASPSAAVGTAESTVVVLDRGVVNSSVALSGGPLGLGSAWTGGGAVGLDPLFFGADVTWFASRWQVVGAVPTNSHRRLVSRASVGVGMGRAGSLGLRFTSQLYHDQPGEVGLAAVYSASLDRGLNLSLQASADQPSAGTAVSDLWTGRPDRELAASLSLSWSPGHAVSLSSGVRTDEQGASSVVRAQRGAPAGEGFGFGAEVAADAPTGEGLGELGEGERRWALDGVWRGPFTIATAATQRGADDAQSWSGSVAGGLVLLDGSLHATRPVHDSFGLVKTGKVAGLPVYRANQEVGRTNEDGELLVPNMLSYQRNPISLDISSLPMDYSVKEEQLEAIPALRSGVIVEFEVKRFTAVMGRLVTAGDEAKPLGLGMLSVRVDDQDFVSPVGPAGSFYFEDVPVGSYVAMGRFAGQAWTCAFTVAPAEATLTDLGEVRCETRP